MSRSQHTPSRVTTTDAVSHDILLIERLRANDESALEIVMDRYLDDVLSIAFHYVRSTDMASDIAQTVFIQLWERRHALDPNGNLAHYVRRATRNAALTVLRHESAVARAAQTAAREYEIVRSQHDDTRLSAVEIEELNNHVRHVLDRLSPRVREVALLYHQEGLEPGEIADLLGVAPRTVYNQLRTAMRALTQEITKTFPK